VQDIAELQSRLRAAGYIADAQLAAALALVMRLDRPLLVEGEAGVGKTEVAKALAAAYGRRLIRLQCYEGLDVNAAVYEWNYQRQLLAIKIQEGAQQSAQKVERHIFGPEYLLKRPLLAAITEAQPPLLLIDEIDRADEEFEAYLLEVLSDYQISIPELGTIEAVSIPWVVLTSNSTRELSDALRRRCLYHWLDYPDFDKELAIVQTKLPEAGAQLARQVVGFVQQLRRLDLRKKPGIAESLDWAAALLGLGVGDIEERPEAIMGSLACLLKTREDRGAVTGEVVRRLVANAG
jgi:MoxR-like ATPase